MFFLNESNVFELVGKKVTWKAPAYKCNSLYGGVAIIEGVDFGRRFPIMCKCLSGDDLGFAFLDCHGLESTDGGETYRETPGNRCFTYSDNYREVEVWEVDD